MRVLGVSLLFGSLLGQALPADLHSLLNGPLGGRLDGDPTKAARPLCTHADFSQGQWESTGSMSREEAELLHSETQCPFLRHNYRCEASNQYMEHLQRRYVPGYNRACTWAPPDPKHEPPFPANSKVLFLGNSHLREVFEAVNCLYSPHIVTTELLQNDGQTDTSYLGKEVYDAMQTVTQRLLDFNSSSTRSAAMEREGRAAYEECSVKVGDAFAGLLSEFDREEGAYCRGYGTKNPATGLGCSDDLARVTWSNGAQVFGAFNIYPLLLSQRPLENALEALSSSPLPEPAAAAVAGATAGGDDAGAGAGGGATAGGDDAGAAAAGAAAVDGGGTALSLAEMDIVVLGTNNQCSSVQDQLPSAVEAFADVAMTQPESCQWCSRDACPKEGPTGKRPFVFAEALAQLQNAGFRGLVVLQIRDKEKVVEEAVKRLVAKGRLGMSVAFLAAENAPPMSVCQAPKCTPGSSDHQCIPGPADYSVYMLLHTTTNGV